MYHLPKPGDGWPSWIGWHDSIAGEDKKRRQEKVRKPLGVEGERKRSQVGRGEEKRKKPQGPSKVEGS